MASGSAHSSSLSALHQHEELEWARGGHEDDLGLEKLPYEDELRELVLLTSRRLQGDLRAPFSV